MKTELDFIYIYNFIPENFFDQLRENMDAEINCASFGFPDGGTFFYDPLAINYRNICFEYEDQPRNAQGNNCNTITLAAGEHRTCTVKNYIRLAVSQD